MNAQAFAEELVRELEGVVLARIEDEGLKDDEADEVWDAVNRLVQANGIG